jgi:surface protein
MPMLPYLADADFLPIVETMVSTVNAKQIKIAQSLASNVLDPFNAVFQGALLNLTRADWEKMEAARQIQKTFEHQMGHLHQSVLGALPNWSNLNTGNVTDLLNVRDKVCAEVKNKHNTVKASDEATVYDKLLGLIGSSGAHRGFTAYYAVIVPKRTAAMNEPFTPSDNASGVKKPVNQKIRKIDGYSFYALATEREHALHELFEALPKAVRKVAHSSLADASSFQDLFNAAYGSR